ncbi:unnamed protein product [Rhodiola kirilowii]
MACCNRLTPLPLYFSRPRALQRSQSSRISCQVSSDSSQSDENNDKNRIGNLLTLSVTLTVVSTSIYQKSALAAKTVKKQPKRSAAQVVLSPDEVKAWAKGLPVVAEKIPFTEVLDFCRRGELKHVIKSPTASALKQKQHPESVLVVLQDSRVFKSVLPSLDGNTKFWDEWNELSIDSFCVNAYTPPVKKPELPTPYLWFLAKVPEWMAGFVNSKKKKPASKKALEFKKMKLELEKKKMEELERMQQERELLENALRRQKKEEDRRVKMEIRRKKHERELREARSNYKDMANMWAKLASDSNLSTALGLLFFYIFYRVVVLNYRKQQKDYEDRLKIERAEREERKKLRELEREMQGLEGADDEIDGGTGAEENSYMKVAKQFMKSGARVRRAQNRRLPQYLERGVDVKFTDVAGLGKIRLELEEIVKFFTHAETYRRRGVKIPGGILLCGPPGVGKTLLAKAVAGEAGVNFFSISASQFVEIYVGVGASRVRALYQEARENAPSVVFIDELDAVGRERGLIKGSGGQERDATLNQLLVCLDGFEGRGEVVTIASTNRPDILDPALVRPGRFDRKIYIPKPGLIGRVEILKVHARKKPMAEDVAAINMLREGRTEITTDDLLQAAQMEERGLLDRKDRSPETWRQVAINEAAMAVVAVNFPDLKNIEFVTISPRAGRELGYVRFKMDHIKFKEGMLSQQSLLDHITVQLAPRAADELWYGEDKLSTIWAETADNARSDSKDIYKINDIDLEALRVLHECYERAKEGMFCNNL